MLCRSPRRKKKSFSPPGRSPSLDCRNSLATALRPLSWTQTIIGKVVYCKRCIEVMNRSSVVHCKLNGRVDSTCMVKKAQKAFFPMQPDHKKIVDEALEELRSLAIRCCCQDLLFKNSHEEVGEARCHAGTHRRSESLTVVFSLECEAVYVKHEMDQFQHILSCWNTDRSLC